jgi:hypothetical protein
MNDQSKTKAQLISELAVLRQHETEQRHTGKVQAALYLIADATSAVKDMQQFYMAIHQIIGDLMYARNFFIALYDEQTAR